MVRGVALAFRFQACGGITLEHTHENRKNSYDFYLLVQKLVLNALAAHSILCVQCNDAAPSVHHEPKIDSVLSFRLLYPKPSMPFLNYQVLPSVQIKYSEVSPIWCLHNPQGVLMCRMLVVPFFFLYEY